MIAQDTSAVDVALAALISSDATLAGLLPDGVWWGVAPAGATRFVILAQVDHGDAYTIGNGVAWDRIVYLAKAVTAGDSGSLANQAAAQIHKILQGAVIQATGYHPSIVVQRLERVRPPVEIDDQTDQRWHHAGGQYEILITPLPEQGDR